MQLWQISIKQAFLARACLFVAFSIFGCGKIGPEAVPAPVTDLVGVIGLQDRVVFKWSSPQIIPEAEPTAFDIRYSTKVMATADDWASAIKIEDAPMPSSAGTTFTFELTGLTPVTAYYLAMRVVGKNGQLSQFSTQLYLSTADTTSTKTFTAYDLSGNLHSTSELIGHKLVMLDFWGVWCGWCVKETPDLLLLYSVFKDSGVMFVGLEYGDEIATGQNYIEKNNIPWLNLVISREISRMFGISGYPTKVFLNSKGEYIGSLAGYGGYSYIANALSYLLANSSDTISVSTEKVSPYPQ